MCCKSYFVWPWSSLILIVQSQNYFYGKSQNLWKFWDAQSTDAFSAPNHSTAKFLIIQESWNILRGHHQREIFNQTLWNSFGEKTIIDHKSLTTVHFTHLIFYLYLWYSQELDFANIQLNERLSRKVRSKTNIYWFKWSQSFSKWIFFFL